MRSTSKGILIAFLGMLSAASVPSAAGASDWPHRPVRIVSAFAAGGTADLVARTVADHFTSAFNRPFIVESRPGASGTIAVNSVVNADPDGHTLVVTTSTLLVLLPISNPNLAYHPTKSLTNIGYIAGTPVVLSVNGKSQFKTLDDLISNSKSRTKPLTYSSSGVGSSGHLVAELFATKAGINIEHVPYKGASQGLADLIGGHIDFSAQLLPSTTSFMKEGVLRPLVHSARDRIPDFPHLPTFRERGFDIVATTWYSLSGPAGLSQDVVNRLNAELRKGMALPANQERLRRSGMITESMTVDEFRKFIEVEAAYWRPVIERAGLVQKPN